MGQAMVNIRMDEDLKKSMEQVCQELGMSMTTAFTIFAKKMSREKRIPFEVSVDPFFSDHNLSFLREGIAELNAGKGVRKTLKELEEMEDEKTMKRINMLLRDISRDPFSGVGKPEPLKGDLSGFWSRRIDDVHRLVYRVKGDTVEILSCKGHYD